MATMRESSRGHWNSQDTIEDINCGSLQRIADATELMAKNYQSLINDRDNYQKWYRERGERIDGLNRKISALRGQITKLKKAKEAVNA